MADELFRRIPIGRDPNSRPRDERCARTLTHLVAQYAPGECEIATLATADGSDRFRFPSGTAVALAREARVPRDLLNIEPLQAVATCRIRATPSRTDAHYATRRAALQAAVHERSPLAPQLFTADRQASIWTDDAHWEPELGPHGSVGVYRGPGESPDYYLSVRCEMPSISEAYYQHWKAEIEAGRVPTAGELHAHPSTTRLQKLVHRNACRLLYVAAEAFGALVPYSDDTASVYFSSKTCSPPLVAVPDHAQLLNASAATENGPVVFYHGATAPPDDVLAGASVSVGDCAILDLGLREGLLIAGGIATRSWGEYPAALAPGVSQPASSERQLRDATIFCWEGSGSNARLATVPLRSDVLAEATALGANLEKSLRLLPVCVKIGNSN